MLPATCIEVSVIVPVYNGERHLAEAIRSILEQDYCPLELILRGGHAARFPGMVCPGDRHPVERFRGAGGIGGTAGQRRQCRPEVSRTAAAAVFEHPAVDTEATPGPAPGRRVRRVVWAIRFRSNS